MEVNVDVFAAVHAELATHSYNDAVGDVGDVDGAGDAAADDQAVLDVAQVEGREGGAASGWWGEIDDAAREVRDCG